LENPLTNETQLSFLAGRPFPSECSIHYEA